MKNRKALIQKIHIAKTQMGISEEEYHEFLIKISDTPSCTQMNEKQLTLVIDAFFRLGYPRKQKKLPVNNIDVVKPSGVMNATSRQIYYIKGLWELASRKKDEQSLRSLLKRIAGVDDLRFLNKAKASHVIRALRKIAEKAGFDPDSPPRGIS